MIPKTMLAALGTALVLAVSAPAWGHGSQGHGPGWGPGMAGPGMMAPGWGPGPYGPGMGPGMMWHHQGPGWGRGHMGPGWGPGHMGPGWGPGHMAPGWGAGPGYGAAPREDLAADDVREMLERRLAFHGNPRIKVGEVTERDEDTIVADIVTQDGSLVQRFEIDRHRGYWRQAE